MNSTLRDFLILLLVSGGIFAMIYGWISYKLNSEDEPEGQQNESMIGEEMKELMAVAFEEQLHFIENDYTREFEAELNKRFSPHMGKGIHIIEGGQVNAFTTVGDRVYLYRGLVTGLGDPGLVAAVVAHELGHIHHNHVEVRLKREVGSSLLASILTGGNQGMIVELSRTVMGLSFNRAQELEADDFAMELLEQAGIHPQNLARAFLRMKSINESGSGYPPAFLSTHPSIEERIERILERDIPDDFYERPFVFGYNWTEIFE